MVHFDTPHVESGSHSVDPLFEDLDQQEIADGAGGWTTEVIGIHRSDRDIWIQIGTSEAVEDTILLHMSPWATSGDALTALQEWSGRDEARRPRIVEVMRHM